MNNVWLSGTIYVFGSKGQGHSGTVVEALDWQLKGCGCVQIGDTSQNLVSL